MALIPLNQNIQVFKKTDGDTGLDAWGNPIVQAPVDMKCRVDEGSFVTSDQESYVTGKVIVANVRVMLEGLADVGYDDEIEYRDELGNIIKRKPKRINIKRNIAGNPILTEVLL